MNGKLKATQLKYCTKTKAEKKDLSTFQKPWKRIDAVTTVCLAAQDEGLPSFPAQSSMHQHPYLAQLICSLPCTVRKANCFIGKGHRKLCCLADSLLRKPLFLPARNNSFSASFHMHIKPCIVYRLLHCFIGNCSLLDSSSGVTNHHGNGFFFLPTFLAPLSPPTPASPSLQVPGSISAVIKPLLFG